jgi:hypothetical protein
VLSRLTRESFAGNAGFEQVEKSAASGTNCRFQDMPENRESHQFISFFTVARCLLT